MAKKVKAKVEEGYEILEDWSTELGIPVNDIREVVDELKEKIKIAHPDKSDDEARDIAIGRFFSSKKKHLTDIGTDKVVIKILQNTGPFDWVAAKRAVALAEYEKDPTNAVNKGFVNLVYNDLGEVVEINPRYYWPLNRAKKPNKKLGEELPDYNYLWFMSGIGLLKSELDKGEFGKKIRKVEISIPNEYANPKSKSFIPVITHEWLLADMRVTGDDKKIRTLSLEAKEITNLTNVFENSTLNRLKDSSISKLFKSQIITLKDLTLTFEKNVQWGSKKEHSRGTNKTFLSSVFVAATDPGNEGLSGSIAVVSPEMGMIDKDGNEVKPIKVWWKDSLPLDFGEGTKLELFYRMKQNELKSGDNFTGEWGNITFDAQGFIMLVKEKREVDKQKKEPVKKPKGSKKIEANEDEEPAPETIEDDELDFEDMSDLDGLVDDIIGDEKEIDNESDEKEIDNELDEEEIDL